MVSATRDVSGNLKLYVDGVLDNSGSGFTGNATNTNYSFIVGKYDTGNYPFNGYISNVRVYYGALSETQIQTLYNNRKSLLFLNRELENSELTFDNTKGTLTLNE
jgi:hypothetical protein